MRVSAPHPAPNRFRQLIAAYCLLSFVYCLLPLASQAAEAGPTYDVEVRIDLDAGRYSGREAVRYTNRSKGPVNAVYFNLYPNVGAAAAADRLLSVTSARVMGRDAGYRHEGSGLLVRLPGPLGPGRSAEVALEFEGQARRVTAEQTGLGAHVTDQVGIVLTPAEQRPLAGGDEAVAADGAMLLGNPFPVLSASRDDGWRRQDSAGGYVLVEAASYRVTVTAGDGVDVVGSGGPSPGPNGSRVFEGKRLRSVALFASRGMERQEGEAAGVALNVVATPGHAPAARRALEALSRTMGVYAELFGPPPFSEMTVVEAPLVPGTPSAAYSGLAAVATAYFVDMRSPEAEGLPGFIRDTPELTEGELEFAVMRETARQWWGQAVAVDPQREAFLEEGLTTYSAVVATERTRGPEGAADAVEQRLRAPYRVFRMFGGLDAPADRRAGEFPNYFAYAAIVGAKGGLFVEALRKKLGDDRFFAGLRRYYEAGAGHIVRRDYFFESLVPGDQRGAVDRLYDRWIEEEHGDEDIGAPEYAVAVDPKADKGSAFERFGRFIGRKLAGFGKKAAKPF